ncbi:MAG: hypothetical protein ACXAC2_23370, partial [Candidatus Kariarchaeaceae archaeon]
MSSASSNVSDRKRKRGITRRVRDDQGNIRVIKYAKRSTGLRIPGLTWGKLPSLILGLPLLTYASLIYANKNGYLGDDSISEFGKDIANATDGADAAIRLVVGGTIGMVLALFFGYFLVRKGFKIRRYPAASREIIALWAISIVLLAITSPFINEPGLVRHQEDPVIDEDDFDVSGLSSPFYDEFLNGLLDLLGNIPQPDEQVAWITPGDPGDTFDYNEDRYLYRWRVAETYDTGLADFDQAYTSTQLDYDDNGEFNYNSATGDKKKLRIQEQYLTISSTYTGDALVPWHSEFGGMIGDTDDVTAELGPDVSGELIEGSVSGHRDINEQPVLNAAFDESRTSGFIEYDSYWVADDKDYIADNSVNMSQLDAALDDYDQERFGDLSIANPDEISGIWGEQSLPGTDQYAQDSPGTLDDAFVTKFGDYSDILSSNEDISTYNFALLVSNDVQNAVIQGLLDGSLNIDPTQSSGVAEEGADKA